MRRRLDAELTRRGLAASRTQAQNLIEAGRVTVDGAVAAKAAALVTSAQALVVSDAGPRWASRGAHKLRGALDALGVNPAGRHCLDAGAAHGGFTDVLLTRGAARVIAVDVGYGQLLWRLRSDARVVVLDRTNVRHLAADQVPPPAPDLVVADLSFISLTLVLPALVRAAAADAEFLPMVKPQFELEAAKVGRGGVVRDPSAWRDALGRVATSAAELGLGVVGTAPSPLPGPAGNVEFFLHLRPGATSDPALIDAAIAAGEEISTAGGRDPGTD